MSGVLALSDNDAYAEHFNADGPSLAQDSRKLTAAKSSDLSGTQVDCTLLSLPLYLVNQARRLVGRRGGERDNGNRYVMRKSSCRSRQCVCRICLCRSFIGRFFTASGQRLLARSITSSKCGLIARHGISACSDHD